MIAARHCCPTDTPPVWIALSMPSAELLSPGTKSAATGGEQRHSFPVLDCTERSPGPRNLCRGPPTVILLEVSLRRVGCGLIFRIFRGTHEGG
jgi:hypothetical protein